VGQDGILRAGWQPAQACADCQSARRLPTCPTSHTDPLPDSEIVETLNIEHDDRFGTPQLATDSSQAVAWSVNYQPFGQTGNVQSSLAQPRNLRLPGQQADAESGIYHNGFRDYVPTCEDTSRATRSVSRAGLIPMHMRMPTRSPTPTPRARPPTGPQGFPSFRAFLYKMEKQGDGAPAARLAELCQEYLSFQADPIASVFIATAVPYPGHENSRNPFNTAEENEAERAAAEKAAASAAHQRELKQKIREAREARELAAAEAGRRA
jgi:hypothetical protein